MSRHGSFVEIDGRRIAWKDLLRRRREQRQAQAKAQQPALFELKEDHRPAHDRTAGARYAEPSLFSLLSREG